MATAQLQGLLRGTVRAFTGVQQPQIVVGDGGELIVNAGLPPEAELARTGAGVAAFCTTVGTAATQTIPTTAAGTTLFNNNAIGSGIHYVIAAVGATVYTGSATQGPSAYSLFVRNDVPAANTMVLTASGTQTAFNCTNGNTYAGVAAVKQGVTLAAISSTNNTCWIPAQAGLVWGATASLGSFYGLTLWAECFGRWIVKPQGVFSQAIIGGVAASNLSFVGGFVWYEVVFSNK